MILMGYPVNLSTFQVKKNDEPVELTLKEFEILKLLLIHPDQTFSKQENVSQDLE